MWWMWFVEEKGGGLEVATGHLRLSREREPGLIRAPSHSVTCHVTLPVFATNHHELHPQAGRTSQRLLPWLK